MSLGVELHRSNTDVMCEFRNRCREFVDRLVDVILGQQVVSSDFLQGLYCFCPELLLEGDDHHVFQLFSRLVRVLERCGYLSSCDAQSSREEFATFVVDARSRHRESEKSTEQIKDVTEYLFSDYSFMSRRSLVQVLKVCCLVVDRPQRKMTDIEIDLQDCAVPVAVVTSSLRGVQSLVSSPGTSRRLSSPREQWKEFVMPLPVVAISCPVLVSTLGSVCRVVIVRLLCEKILQLLMLI